MVPFKMNLIFVLVLWFSTALAQNGVEEFTNGNRMLTAQLYNILLDSNENFLVSPFSAETIVALTQSGAVGATGEEMRSSLSLPSTKANTEAVFKTLLPSIHSDHISLHTANKVFVENGFPIKEGFQKVARDVYQADFENIEFMKSQEAADEINQWVEEETNNKIRNLVTPEDFDGSTVLVLVNALYFQGNWTRPFIPFYTKTAPFYTDERSTVDCTMMYQKSEEYNYAENEELDAQILEIPFQGKEATMVVVLPKKREGIALVEKQIRDVLTVSKFTKEHVEVFLPKFKIESTIDFKNVLEKLGVHKAFDSAEADFSEIAGEKGDLYISDARQKTYIDVSEAGVEAAAATEIEIDRNGPLPATKTFTADHPFLFYIKLNSIVLFEGRVSMPVYD